MNECPSSDKINNSSQLAIFFSFEFQLTHEMQLKEKVIWWMLKPTTFSQHTYVNVNPHNFF